MKAFLSAIWKQLSSLNRSKITHGITLAFVISIATLVALDKSLPAGSKWEIEIGLFVATLTRAQYLWQRVIPLLDGSSVVQTTPPDAGVTPALRNLAVDPSQVRAAADIVSRSRDIGGSAMALLLAAGLALGSTSCHNRKGDSFFQAVVACTEDNTQNTQAGAAVLRCLTDAVGGDYAACLQGLVAGGYWTVSEVACLVRGYAQNAATRLNAGNAATDDQVVLERANAWLKAERVRFR